MDFSFLSGIFASPWDILRNIIDIAIIAYVFYRLLAVIKGSRAEQLLKGLVILLIFSDFQYIKAGDGYLAVGKNLDCLCHHFAHCLPAGIAPLIGTAGTGPLLPLPGGMVQRQMTWRQ